MITLENVSFKYNDAKDYTIRDASCSLPAGGISAIVGKSGVGKSTLIALLAGLYDANDEKVETLSGHIVLDGLVPSQLRGPACASWMPSEFAFLDHLTVRRNVLVPMTIERDRLDSEERCETLLRGLGIWECRDLRVLELSVGMRTRVALARALISRPIYLFLDEPFASLDVDNRFHAYRILCGERRQPGLTTFITTHDVPEAVLLADRIMIMSDEAATTSLTVYETPRIEFGCRATQELLREARERAPAIERLIYGSRT